MTARIVIDLELDAAAIEREGARRGFPLVRAFEAVLSDCENRLVDSVRFRDGVARVGSNLQLTGVTQ